LPELVVVLWTAGGRHDESDMNEENNESLKIAEYCEKNMMPEGEERMGERERETTTN
jgi:hypothetical protein